jgi:hypothetical protein
MVTAVLTLVESLSHTVRLKGQSEIRFVKGMPVTTSDEDLINYVKARGSAFSISVTKSEPEAKPKVDEAVGSPGEEEKDDESDPAPISPVIRRPAKRPVRSGGDR